MSSILDILIERENLEDAKLKELYNEWGGKCIPYTPAKYAFGNELVFHENEKLDIYQKKLNDSLDGYIALTLEGSSLSNLEILANKKREELKENELLRFIENLFGNLENVTLIKFLNEERIDFQYSFKDINQVVSIFLESLDWNSPKGIIIRK